VGVTSVDVIAMEEATFFERVARMFRGHDTPDPELVRTVLASYRDPDEHGDVAP
jgi:hypothetical protein